MEDFDPTRTRCTPVNVLRFLELVSEKLGTDADGHDVLRAQRILKRHYKRITKRDRDALGIVLNMAIENSCSCGGTGTGFMGHETECWVHKLRMNLSRVMRLRASAAKFVRKDKKEKKNG